MTYEEKYYYTTEEILLFLGNRIISERSWDYLKNLLFRRGKVSTDILSMELVGAEQELFNYIQENPNDPIDFDIIHRMVVYPLKMRITSFTFRKGQDALCKLEGIVF
jgi:hypothetical protein